MWKPKSVRDQSQKLAWIISFQGFEMKIIKKENTIEPYLIKNV